MDYKNIKVSTFYLVLFVLLAGCSKDESYSTNNSRNKTSTHIRERKYKLDEQTLVKYQNDITNGTCTETTTKELVSHFAKFKQDEKETNKWLLNAAKNGCADYHITYAIELMWYGIQTNNKKFMNKALELIAVNTSGDTFQGISAIYKLWPISTCMSGDERYAQREVQKCEKFLERNKSWKTFFTTTEVIAREYSFILDQFNPTPIECDKKKKLKEHLPVGYQILNDKLSEMQNSKDEYQQNLAYFWSKNKANLLNVEELITDYKRRESQRNNIPTYTKEQKQRIKSLIEETENKVKFREF